MNGKNSGLRLTIRLIAIISTRRVLKLGIRAAEKPDKIRDFVSIWVAAEAVSKTLIVWVAARSVLIVYDRSVIAGQSASRFGAVA